MAETRTIWKCPLDLVDQQFIDCPSGATFLTAQAQYGQLVVWAIVDPNQTRSKYAVRIIGTGHEFAADLLNGFRHIGTAQVANGSLVWHVFVRGGES